MTQQREIKEAKRQVDSSANPKVGPSSGWVCSYVISCANEVRYPFLLPSSPRTEYSLRTSPRISSNIARVYLQGPLDERRSVSHVWDGKPPSPPASGRRLRHSGPSVSLASGHMARPRLAGSLLRPNTLTNAQQSRPVIFCPQLACALEVTRTLDGRVASSTTSWRISRSGR